MDIGKPDNPLNEGNGINLRMDRPGKRLKDKWKHGEHYERYVGRWSRIVAAEFLDWLAIPAGRRWLDAGCGTGMLSRAILQFAAPQMVTGIDRSPGFIAYAREQVTDQRAGFALGDAQSLPAAAASYDVFVSGLVLNFLPDPGAAVREMARVVRPEGVVAVYVWDYAGKMQFMRQFWDAAAALDPVAASHDEGRRFPLCQPRPLTELFEQAGLKQVHVVAIDIATNFKDFDDYWSPFLGGQGPAPAYLISLSDNRREALRERIRAGLPFAIDGSIPLMARAWAVRGMR